MTDPSDLFDRAREAVRVSDIAGGKLARVKTRLGEMLRGQCRVCKAGEGKLQDGPFWVDDAKGRWGCFAGQGDCQRGGDAIRLEQLLRGGSPREIAGRFAGASWTPTTKAEITRRDTSRPRRSDGGGAKSDLATRLRRESRLALTGGLVDLYLAARGIGATVRGVMCAELRYHPEAFYDVAPAGARLPAGAKVVRMNDGGRGVLLPAMIAEVRTRFGLTGGVHVTFLKPDGSGKARVKRPKKMVGPQIGHGLPGGAFLSPFTGDFAGRPLIDGEGIETVGSAAEFYFRDQGVVPRMAAALSLDRLSGGWKADERGRYDVDAPAADWSMPAFTLPDAGEVLVAVDRDMKSIAVPVRGPGGRRVKRTLSQDERARVSGALATQFWRREGASPVRVIAPPAGMDFNDHLRECAA